MKILMVLTSHARLGDSGRQTGFWLEEFASPYYVFKDAGADVVIASPNGGQPPMDPKSDSIASQTPATIRFHVDADAKAALSHSRKLSDVVDEPFDAIFYPGGHGPLWDLAKDSDSIRLIETTYAAGKPVASVCHGPAAFKDAVAPDGSPLVQGKSVTGFANSEEAAGGLAGDVPFQVEDMLKHLGGNYSKADDWQSYTVTDGNLVTGQNPASSTAAAKDVLTLLAK